MGSSDESTAEQQDWFIPNSEELLQAYAQAREASIENLNWHDLSLCRGLDTENFYDEYEQSRQHARVVDQLCDHCPVQKVCHSVGEQREYGKWGDTYWDGKGNPDKRYNKHKETDGT